MLGSSTWRVRLHERHVRALQPFLSSTPESDSQLPGEVERNGGGCKLCGSSFPLSRRTFVLMCVPFLSPNDTRIFREE